MCSLSGCQVLGVDDFEEIGVRLAHLCGKSGARPSLFSGNPVTRNPFAAIIAVPKEG